MRWRFFLAEAMTSIRSNAATTLAAVVTVLIVTFLLGFTVSAGKWVYDYTVGVRNDVTIKAYVPDAMAKDSAELGKVHDRIQGMQYVKTVTYVSPQKALTLLTKTERKNAQLLPGNPLPPSFWVKLTDPSKVNQVADQLGTIPQIHNCEPARALRLLRPEDHQPGARQDRDRAGRPGGVHHPAGGGGGRPDPEHDPPLDLLPAP